MPVLRGLLEVVVSARDEAYRAGAQGWLDGLAREENPLNHRTGAYHSWDYGWTDKRDEMKTRDLLSRKREDNDG